MCTCNYYTDGAPLYKEYKLVILAVIYLFNSLWYKSIRYSKLIKTDKDKRLVTIEVMINV